MYMIIDKCDCYLFLFFLFPYIGLYVIYVTVYYVHIGI